MSSEAITSVFNDGYIAEIYDAYKRDPASVDESWRQFFRLAVEFGGGQAKGQAASEDLLHAAAGAASLTDAIRAYGHMAVAIDPLGSPPPGAAELSPEFHHVTENELASVPGSALGLPDATAADAVARLRSLYCSTLGFEFEHLGSAAERQWLREVVESGSYQQPLTADEQKTILRRLTEVDALERFLGRAYQGYKRFSIEGSDALVVMLDELIALAALSGARDVALAMAHRGRINVLAHILGMPYSKIFDEFEGRHPENGAVDSSGDVKYHLGYDGAREIGGRRIALTLVPNPSHLEFVNPVLEGVARAKQRDGNGGRDESAVIPVCVHGDAAFPGEGIVSETLNLALLPGFRTGGTVHIIVNNQVGFTTDPLDGRSTRYASDPAKGFDIPIVHVNGDDAQACVQAVRFAAAYRATFGKDALIDLVSYRRHGHNETDEPAFTQPVLYQKVRAHKTPREVWGERLVAAGVLSAAEVQGVEREIMAKLEQIQQGARPEVADGQTTAADAGGNALDTAVGSDALNRINEELLSWPADFKPNSRVARTLGRRRDAMGDKGGIDWGHAEALALGSLLREGKSVRMTGQDVERGTFSHRQAVLHDSENGQLFVPLNHVEGAKGEFHAFNSPLSETAVLGFEYGYSVVATDTLVMWEAQYGDFANVAQPIVDQFISSGRAKWGQECALAMLLPHGYEGGGPEHSSARLERYLQLCAEGNMRVAYPTTPAQYFHVIRRQANSPERRPLILMQPKSLLRLPEAASRLSDLTSSAFQPVLDDASAAPQRERVKRVAFCTGKIYYDLLEKRSRDAVPEVALVRVEELYPWPHDQVAHIVDSYPAIEEVVWAQEEPKNMGAWTYVWPRLRVSTGNAISIRYIGRPERASTAEGYAEAHKIEQERIVSEVFALPQPTQGGRARAATR
ncbi:MAG: 2-oxoglutarate dehydrogenase E1 component [Gemmatimonadaceae bacterium]